MTTLLGENTNRQSGYPSREAQLKALIRRRYSAQISGLQSGGRTGAHRAGYDPGRLDRVPNPIAEGWSGCGALAATIDVRPFDVMVDLGCGTGTDTWLIANSDNPPRTIIAVDLTPETLEALQGAAQLVENCTILPVAGDMEFLPLADECCNAVIANGAFSLAVDQSRAFSEALRILRPGGSLQAIDLISDGEFSSDILSDPMGHGTALGGVKPENQLRAIIEGVGFINVDFRNHQRFPPATAIEIRARKPH